MPSIKKLLEALCQYEEVKTELERVFFYAGEVHSKWPFSKSREVTLREHLNQSFGKDIKLAAVGDPESERCAIFLAVTLRLAAIEYSIRQLYDGEKYIEVSTAFLNGVTRSSTKLEQLLGDQYEPIMALVRVLLSDDPLSLYMHDVLSLERAASIVRVMAFSMPKAFCNQTRNNANSSNAVSNSALLMLKLLKKQLILEKFHFSKVHMTTSLVPYATYRAVGRVDEGYKKLLFGGTTSPTSVRGRSIPEFSVEAKTKYQELLAAVNPASRQDTIDKHRLSYSEDTHDIDGMFVQKVLTFRQAQHLKNVALRDRNIVQEYRNKFIEYFVTRAQYQPVHSNEGLGMLFDWLQARTRAEIPMTITVPGKRFFTIDNMDTVSRAGHCLYRGGIQRNNERELDSVPIKHLGKYTTFEDRGADYLEFRSWKDHIMTGNNRFVADEMPKFGALNVGYPTWSTYYPGRPELMKYGVNYYGDVHFVLKEDIKQRTVFTGTDHGMPRRDPFLAICDMLFQAAKFTFKDQKVTAYGRHYLCLDINCLTGKYIKYSVPGLHLEAQIFGTLDLLRASQKVVVAPSVEQEVKEQIARFATVALGVNPEFSVEYLEDKTNEAVVITNILKSIGDELLHLNEGIDKAWSWFLFGS